MKVIFLEDVPNVAKAGEVREVTDGYGRNYLLPKKLALVSQPGIVATVKPLLEKNHNQLTVEVASLTTVDARVGSPWTVIAMNEQCAVDLPR